MDNTTYQKIFEDKAEKDYEFDGILPEYCPNIEKIMKIDAFPKIQDKYIENNKIELKGVIVFKVLYMSDFKGKIKCVNFTSDFSHSFPIRNVPEGNNVISCRITVNNEGAKMQNQRKLLLKARLGIGVKLFSEEFLNLYEPESDDIITLTDNIIVSKCNVIPDIAYRFNESFSLDKEMPEITDIVFADVKICIDSVNVKDNCAEVFANANINAMYESSQDDKKSDYINFRHTIPVKFSIENSSIDKDSYVYIIPYMSFLTAEAKADSYGENKVVNMDFSFLTEAYIYKNESIEVITDAFCTDCECKTKFDLFTYTETEDVSYSKITVDDKITVDLKNISEIADISGEIKFLYTDTDNDTKYICAKTKVSILGSADDGEIVFSEAIHTFKIPSAHPNAALTDYNLDIADIEGYIENGELMISAIFCLAEVKSKSSNANTLISLEKDYDSYIEPKKNTIKIYYPSSGERLWEISKKHHISPDELKEKNCMEGSDIQGRKILIL